MKSSPKVFQTFAGHFSAESLKEFDFDYEELFAISTRFATGGIGRDHTELRAYLTSLLEGGYSDDELSEIWRNTETYYFTGGATIRKMLRSCWRISVSRFRRNIWLIEHENAKTP